MKKHQHERRWRAQLEGGRQAPDSDTHSSGPPPAYPGTESMAGFASATTAWDAGKFAFKARLLPWGWGLSRARQAGRQAACQPVGSRRKGGREPCREAGSCGREAVEQSCQPAAVGGPSQAARRDLTFRRANPSPAPPCPPLVQKLDAQYVTNAVEALAQVGFPGGWTKDDSALTLSW